MSNRTRFAPGIAAAVLLAVDAAAQSNVTFEHDVTWQWPDTLGTSGTLTSTACADVTGDFRPDLFVRGCANPSAIAFFNGLGTAPASQVLTPTCNDLCIAPKAGLDGLDELVFVDSYGLKRLDYLMSLHEFDSPGNISTSGYWQGARIVRSADVNWSGVADYVGVLGEREIVYRRDTSPGTWTESSIEAFSAIKDIQLVRWLGSGAHMAVAVLLADGLRVYDLANGNSLGNFTNSSISADAMAVLPSGGTLVDRVAVLLRVDNGTETLRTYRRTSLSAIVNMTISDAGDEIAASLAAAKMDGDHDFDLVATWKNSQDVHVFENVSAEPPTPGAGSEPAFHMDNHQVVSWTGPDDLLLENQAAVVFKDIDADGIPEILSPLRYRPDGEGQQEDADYGQLACLKTRVDNETGDCDVFPTNPHAVVDEYGTLTVNLLLGTPLELQSGLPTEDRFFEVLVWTQVPDAEETPSLSTPTLPEQVANYQYSIDAVFSSIPEEWPEVQFNNIPIGIELPVGVGNVCLGDVVRFIEVREVVADGNRVYQAGPTHTIAATSHIGMNTVFGVDGCPKAMNTNCYSGSGAGVMRHRKRRPGPPPNTAIVPSELTTFYTGGELSLVGEY